MGTISPDFTDETVIVTGGSSGIGRAVALGFGDAGATVINADVAPEPKDVEETIPTHEAIRDRGGRAEYVDTDVTDPDSITAVVEAAREFGGVDVMVNNAGVHVKAPLREVTPEQLDHVLDVNVRGVLFGCQAAANDMLDRADADGEPAGCIVNTASISSVVAQYGQPHYVASKGAVKMITRSAALELAPEIRVNAVAPGQIATEIMEGWTREAQEETEAGDLIKPVPLERAGSPEDLVGAFCYLASEQASYVTGELLFVDGGWTAI